MIVLERDLLLGGDKSGERGSNADTDAPSSWKLRLVSKTEEAESGEAGVKERRGWRRPEVRSASWMLNAEETSSLNSATLNGDGRGSVGSDMDEQESKGGWGRII